MPQNTWRSPNALTVLGDLEFTEAHPVYFMCFSKNLWVFCCVNGQLYVHPHISVQNPCLCLCKQNVQWWDIIIVCFYEWFSVMLWSVRITIWAVIILFGKQPIFHTPCSLWGSSFIASCAEISGLCDENGGIPYYMSSFLTFIE